MTDKLYFCSTAYGGFGIARVGSLIPEGHILFVCPPACGRHTALSSMLVGYRKKMSYLFFDERELSLGTIEDAVYDAVDKILERLKKRPRVILVYFCCSLCISGMDEDLIVSELAERHPDTVFQVCLMNPIVAGSGPSPAQTIHARICRLFDIEKERTNVLNFIGNNVPLDRECEIYAVLRSCGVESTNHISETTSFDEIRNMGSARWNLVIQPDGILAAKELSGKIEHRFLPVSYDLKVIKCQYSEVFSMLGTELDLSDYERRAEERINAARSVVGGREIAIGSSSTCSPFGMAKALVSYGFNVTSVFGSGVASHDSEAYSWIQENASHIRVYDTESTEMVSRVGKCGRADISIGYSAGYFTGSDSVVGMVGDEGLFGYYGVERLMQMLMDSVSDPKDLQTMMESYGLVV
ncbi:MAG: nitrogenase component 1 [Candidatus Methanoplasma sp.]|jgi:hypothetical protein|nr:nitrogenase component 1 [Candidatus Methanoplasma sp.]